jgi:DNA-binding transcriptional regulator YiaG
MQKKRFWRPRAFTVTPAELRELRKRAGLSQKAAATLLGVCFPTYTSWERKGVAAPKAAVIVLQIAAARRESILSGKRQEIFDLLDTPFDVSL